MTETTTAASSAAKKATEKTVAAVSDAMPTVIETVEVAMEVPAKVVLNQKLVVIASLLAGSAFGAGVLYGVNKWRSRKSQEQVDVPDDISSLDDAKKP